MRRRRLLMVGGTALLAGCPSGNNEITDTNEPSETTTQSESTATEQSTGTTSAPTTTEQTTESPTETKTTASGTVETTFTFPSRLTVGEQFNGSLTVENSTQSTVEIPEISLRSEYGGQTETLSLTESNQVPAGETVEANVGPIVPKYAEDLTVAIGPDEFAQSVSVASVDGQTFQSDDGLSITVEPASLYSNLLLKGTDDVYSPDSGNTLLRVDVSAEGWVSGTASDRFFIGLNENNSTRILQEFLSTEPSEIDWPSARYEGQSETPNGGWVVFEVPTQSLENGTNIGWNRNPSSDNPPEEVVWNTSLSGGIQNASQTSHMVNWPTFVHKNEEFDVTVDIENPSELPYTFQASISLSNIEGGSRTIDMDERVAAETNDQRTAATLSPSDDIETPGEISSPGGGITVGPPRLAFSETYNGLTLERADSSAPIEYETEDGYTITSNSGGIFLKITADGVSPAPGDFHAFDGNGDDTTGLVETIHSGDVSQLVRPVEGEVYEQGDDSGWIALDYSGAMEIGFMAAGWYPDSGESNIVEEMSAEALWYTEELSEYQEEEEEWWRYI